MNFGVSKEILEAIYIFNSDEGYYTLNQEIDITNFTGLIELGISKETLSTKCESDEDQNSLKIEIEEKNTAI